MIENTKGSEWTVSTILQHLEAVHKEMDRRYEQRFQSQEAAIKAALAAQEKAVMVAEEVSRQWREQANEWRKTVTDVISLSAQREQRSEGRGSGLNSGWIYLIGIVSLAGTIVAMVLAFVRK